MTYWQPYLIAAAIGLLVGIEREKSHPSQGTLGIRTFLLISLLGSVAKGIHNPWLGALVAAFSFGLILISYFNETRDKAKTIDRGLTTEFAAGLVFCLGYAAHELPALTAVIGPAVALILFSKTPLHHFTRSLKPAELEAALLLLLGVVVVVNLVPDAVIDPWRIFNPRKFGYLVLTLATLEFSSYAIAKVIGEKRGSLLFGFLGGFVSSTAVLLSSAKRAKNHPEQWRSPLCSTLAACLAALVELGLIVGLISTSLLLRLLPSLAAGLLFGTVALIIVSMRGSRSQSGIELKSPLDWSGVLRLSLLLAGILGAISLAKTLLGERATVFVSLLTGLFELHGVSLANATLFSHGQLSEQSASLNILIATVASFITKVAIGWVVGKGKFARGLTIIFLPMIAIFILMAWLTLGLST
jgi:uncharacterized membrane protein (DUF4010 family)